MLYRHTKSALVHTFHFDNKELQQYGLECERHGYMEGKARERLRQDGLEDKGGFTYVIYGESLNELTTFILVI